jgi:hypothetical protein
VRVSMSMSATAQFPRVRVGMQAARLDATAQR